MRNVMSCPDAGVGLDEPFDCLPDAQLVSSSILARSRQLNCELPSRVNISFGGCPECRHHARLNDAGFVSTVRHGQPGYQLWAGGSLGSSPFLALPVMSFVPRHHVLAAAEAMVDVFVTHGDLDNPRRARLKFLVQDMGDDAFRGAFFEAFDNAVARPHPVPVPVDLTDALPLAGILAHAPEGGWSQSVRPQRRPGLATLTVNVPMGDLDADELVALTNLSVGFADGSLHLTRNQNVALRDVRVEAVSEVRRRLSALDLGLEGADAAVDIRACTGSAVCSLAITAAPSTGHQVMARSTALARNSQLRVHVSGCPNSCAQHQAADIGLSGAKVKIGGSVVLGYQVWVGADLEAGVVGRVIGRVAEHDVPVVVDAVVGAWEATRHSGERFSATVGRVGDDAFSAHVTSIAGGSWEAGADAAEHALVS